MLFSAQLWHVSRREFDKNLHSDEMFYNLIQARSLAPDTADVQLYLICET